MGKKMGSERHLLKTAVNTKVIGIMDVFMGMGSTCGPMGRDSRATGLTESDADKAS